MKIKRRLRPRVRLILHDLGIFLHVPGVMALCSVPVCLWFGEYYAIAPFLATAIAAIVPAFQWVSALTTCGFQTTEIQPWGFGTKLLLSVAMIFGGAAGSTVGGLKLKRIVTLYRGVLWHFQQLFLKPHQLMRYKLNNQVLTETNAYREFYAAATLAILWIVSLAIGVFALLHFVPPEYTLSDVILEAASALGNAGLSTGITDPNLPWGGKLTIILLMWVGRLEIVPLLLLFVSPLSAVKKITSRK